MNQENKGKSWSRKSKKTPESADRIGELSAKGFSIRQIAQLEGISKQTLDIWLAKDSEIRQRWELGKLRYLEIVTGKLQEKIERGDSAAIFFYLKTQANWREQKPTDEDQAGSNSSTSVRVDYGSNNPPTTDDIARLLNAVKGHAGSEVDKSTGSIPSSSDDGSGSGSS